MLNGHSPSTDEKTPLVQDNVKVVINDLRQEYVTLYTRRWYILALFSALAIANSIVWNTWGPIQATARAVYKWEAYVIDLMPFWGSVPFCLTIACMSWLMDVKGLRVSALLTAAFLLSGSAIRSIPTSSHPTVSKVVVFLGQILAGLSSPFVMAAPPLISSAWFPPHQRTTATAIGLTALNVGTAFSFLIGPAFVDDVGKLDIPKVDGNYVLNATLKDKYSHEINTMLFTEAGVVLVIALACLIYFPATPPTPPSRSSAMKRVDFKSGLRQLFHNKNFLALVSLYGMIIGLFFGWMAVLDQCLSEFSFHVDQKLAGWLGFVASMTGTLSAIVFSLIADHFYGHLKLFIVVFISLAFFSVLVILFIFTNVLPFNIPLLYVMFGLCGFFISGSMPFFFELAVEITYPVAEGITSGVITFFNNFVLSILLALPLAHIGSKWFIWANTIGYALAVVSLLFIKERYGRSNVDHCSS